MDLKTERSAHSQSNRAWLANWAMVVGNNVNITVRTTDFVKAEHFPNRFLKHGLALGKYTSGPNDTFWGPFDPAAADGRDVFRAAVFSDFRMKQDSDGTLVATQLAGACLLEGTNVQVFANLLPNVFDGGVSRPVVAADLPTNWVDLSTAL